MSRESKKCSTNREEYHKQYYLKNKEKILKKAKAKYYDNIEVTRKRNRGRIRVYRKLNPEDKKLQRNRHLKEKYNLTLDDYNQMFEQQNGVCAICGNPENTNRMLAVDHNHNTDVIRGLLCFNCNTRLGWYEKQKENINNYLEI